MAPRIHNRSALNYRIDLAALAAAIVVFATGLVLLTHFHMGHGTLASEAIGMSRLWWLNIHRLTAVLLLATIPAHALLHWRSVLTRVGRAWSRLPGKASPADLVLYFGFAVELIAGFSSWLLLPGSAPLAGPIELGPLGHARHVVIDVHNFAGLILLPAAVIHIRRHWQWILPHSRTRSGFVAVKARNHV